jgi:hypothetical protein
MKLARNEFHDLYAEHWPAFESYFRTISNPPLSCPLLLDTPRLYDFQPVRLFVVGRETRSWCNELAATHQGEPLIHELMSRYSAFDCGTAHRKSPFWQFVRKLETGLGIKPGQILWSNLHKCDHGQGPPSEGIAAELRARFPVLRKEIELACPGVVLFLTANDELLKQWFPDCELAEVPESGGLVSHVKQNSLPGLWLRTSHPRALKMSRQWHRTLSLLLKLIREHPDPPLTDEESPAV